ncbi:RNA polymerase subunit sigma [Jeotgalibacillus sp. R-1-5s-1]|uniref:RNA polymerase subunit sigma n=1 Tax=Jeotgalibacillus sp. R-1-5s-1 TaxID=2555897 RepID=UPI00106A7D89|nr:RNA polymerase subunit sigma [Jeotgalibacillus sp. R-1-5s-1]TFE03474.1 RNA polymerase subunit sigma [Jeotgalibacillus sp. R-1-5s-1]
MAFKVISLQMSIPKTIEAGRSADQQQQQNAVTQSQLAALAEKDLLRKRASVNRYGESEKAKLKKQSAEEFSDQSQETERPEVKEKHESQKDHHPFKGRRIDFSG